MCKNVFWVMAATAMIGLHGCGSTSDDTIVNDTVTSVPSSETDDVTCSVPAVSGDTISRYLAVINAYRTAPGGQDCGSEGYFDPAPALYWNDALYRAAYNHSYDMAQTDTFSHDGSGTVTDCTAEAFGVPKSTLVERAEYFGYTDWYTLGENIAAGTDMDTPEEAVAAWMESPSHCADLMNPDFKEVGMAVVFKEGTTYRYYWTQDFGAR